MSDSTVTWRGQQIEIPHLDLSHPEIHYRAQFFSYAFQYLNYNGIDGDYVEFGSASARTFRLAWSSIKALNMKARLWSFDSFEGLPSIVSVRDYHPRWQAGIYSTPLDLFVEIIKSHGMSPDDYYLIPGFYSDSIGPDTTPRPDYAPNIALAYVDCDLYSSTRDVFHFLSPRIKHGMIIAFDDYFCYSSKAISGERLVMLEFLSANSQWQFVPFHPINWHGQSFIVESKSVSDAGAI